jgi:hypothetical protein
MAPISQSKTLNSQRLSELEVYQMRIQDTNKVLNETRIQRNATNHEEARRISTSRLYRFRKNLPSMLRSRSVQGGLIGAAAAVVAATTYFITRRNRSEFSFR